MGIFNYISQNAETWYFSYTYKVDDIVTKQDLSNLMHKLPINQSITKGSGPTFAFTKSMLTLNEKYKKYVLD